MLLTQADLLAIERELCRRSLAEFAKRAWRVLEPAAELKWGWALDAICLHLEAVSKGEITRLLMNVPPGSMKSLLTGVIQDGTRGEFVDYATAEQATMALSAIINTLKNTGVLNDAQHKQLSDALNGAYDATAKDEAFRPEAFVAAMRKLNDAIPRS